MKYELGSILELRHLIADLTILQCLQDHIPGLGGQYWRDSYRGLFCKWILWICHYRIQHQGQGGTSEPRDAAFLGSYI
jgi:hypothetical protein